MKSKRITKSLAFFLSFIMVVSVLSPISALAVTLDTGKLGEDTYLTSKTDYAVAPGITESQITTNNSTGTNQVQGYALEVDLNNPTTQIVSSYKDFDPSKGWGMQKVRDQAYAAEKKLGVNVVGGVNGDFFNMQNGAPTGTFVMQGVTYVKNDNWNYFAIKNDGTPIIGSGYLDTTDIKECIGGPAVLIKDGQLTEAAINNGYGTDQLPRTAVGIKANGSVILYVADGRQAPKSCGQTFLDLANALFALGCVDALCLDGGGSATLISQHEGSDELVCRNSPSDGVERTVSSSLLVISNAKPTGEFDHAAILPNNEVYTPNSTVEFTASGVDSAGSAAELPENGAFVLEDDSFGTIENNTFTSNGKIGEVKVNYVVDGVVAGSTMIEIQTPDSITFSNDEVSLGFEKESDLGLVVRYQGRDINYKVGDIIWTMEDEKMGTFNGNIFVSSDSESITGKITATSGFDASVNAEVTAIIGKLPSIVWDFENPDEYVVEKGLSIAPEPTYTDGATSPKPETTHLLMTYNRGGVGETEIVTKENGEVRHGTRALKISYDYTNWTGTTEGVCFGPVGSSNPIEGTPTALGMWVYAPEGTPNLWLRMYYMDAKGTNRQCDLTVQRKEATDGIGGINWQGWKYVEGSISGVAPFYFSGGMTIRLMYLNPPGNECGFWTVTGGYEKDENGNDTPILNKKWVNQADAKGCIYVDNVQFVYGANIDDTDNPVIDSVQVGIQDGSDLQDITSSTVVKSNDVLIQSSFHDIQNKYTTDINFDNVNVYLDGKDVTKDSIILKGDYMVKYYGTLADGLHSVKILVRDGFNNETTETRYFTVNGGVEYPTVRVVAGTEKAVLSNDFTLNIESNNIGKVNAVNTNIKLDTGIVSSADDLTITFAEGFDGTYTYNAATGMLALSISGSAADAEGWNTIASITAKIPYNTAEGKSFTYRVMDGNITFSDPSIVTTTFAAAETAIPVEAGYVVSADPILVGDDGVFHVKTADGSPAAGVDVYNAADNTVIGTTGEDGSFAFGGFSETVQRFTVYAMKDGNYSFKYSSQSASAACDTDGAPAFVLVNASKNGSTSKNIAWLSNPQATDAKSVVQFAKKADYESKNGETAFTAVEGENQIYTFFGSADIDANRIVRINTVSLDGLDENTSYVYRVGDGKVWSEMKVFSTSLVNGDTNFFFFGDIQAQDTTQIKNLLTAVANDGVDYDFGVQTGDSIETASIYSHWEEILKVFSDENIADTDLIHVLGNHEFMGDPTGAASQAIYNLPDKKYYSLNYGNVYVAVINYAITESNPAEALEWLRQDAAASDATWKVLTLHVPPYNTNTGDSHKYLTENLPKVAQEVGIDFVFSGHDHSYARTKPMTDLTIDEENGITYFICGSSGEKSYGVTVNPDYNFDIATNEFSSIYISVKATDDTFTVTTYDVNGENASIFDSYSKTKKTACTESGHSYTYADGYLTCSVCGYKTPVGSYTGFANDSATGKLMYFIGGNMQKGWVSFGDDHYLFGEDGVAMTGVVNFEGHTYTFGADGKMTRGDLVKLSYGRYVYYINGKTQRGWYFIDGYWYYFDRQNTNNGSAMLNSQSPDGKVTIEGMVYTFDKDSHLVKGALVVNEFGTAYYWGPDPVTGLFELDGYTYYFGSNTYMLINDSVEIDGTVYAFDSEGKFSHYGDHQDNDGDGRCDKCTRTSSFWTFFRKLLNLFEKISKFFGKIFG